jgi:hypothetical protein
MGDRNVVGFRDGANEPTLYLYSHWGGEVQDKTLANALRKVLEAGRESDYPYATRIAISQMIGDDWNHDTGYGISINEYPDPDYDYINVVDWSTGMVHNRLLDHVEQEGIPLAQFIIEAHK